MGDNAVTGIDAILNYLYLNGEGSLSKISSALNVKEETVFEVSKGLEKLGKVIITHKLGRVYIKLK